MLALLSGSPEVAVPDTVLASSTALRLLTLISGLSFVPVTVTVTGFVCPANKASYASTSNVTVVVSPWAR